jgi:crotonobetainyl-CoA:carnitine CoA-transferase CaiB-like acyl-CoA transferase
MTEKAAGEAADEEKLRSPLDGIRVLDFTAVVSGPFCTAMLADMGAEVVKVEPPQGENTRHAVRYPGRGAEHEDYFFVNNRSKKGIALDLKNPAARDAVHALAAKADIVVENFAPGTAARLGIAWDDLHPLNDSLVYCSISGFGQDGPYRDRLALDPICQGYSGIMSITGEADGPPTLTGASITDTVSGSAAAFAIVSALFAARADGKGRYIDLSMQCAAMSAISARMGEYLQAGRTPRRIGNRSFIRIPANSYRCSDGKYIQVMVLTDKHWPLLCRSLGREDWLENEKWLKVAGRHEDQDEIHDRVADIIATMPADHWLTRMNAERLPNAPINDYKDAAEDVQVAHRGLIRTLEHPRAGPIRVVGPGWRISGTETPMAPPPLLNQHMDEVLADWLGWDAAAVEHFRKEVGQDE